MNGKYRMSLCAVSLLFMQASAHADSKPAPAAGYFSCGMFGPNITNSTKADLGLIATAMFATPGQPVPVAFLDQGPWFLIDDYGSGPLMGCQPATSTYSYDQQPRLNSYNANGMLTQQVVQNMGGTQPLKFQFFSTDPNRVTYAEQLCTAVDTTVYRMSFSYTGNQLTKLTVSADPGCPEYGGTYLYTYGSAAVPGLPTRVDIIDSQGNKSAVLFSYNVSNNLLQQTDFTGGNINYQYSGGTLLRQMTINTPGTALPMVINYTPTLQWLSSLDPRFKWGLTMTYQNARVVSTLQDTGCPNGECPPSTFTYLPAKPPGSKACVTALRHEHVAAGRAFVHRGVVYARGSGNLIGPEGLRRMDTLRNSGGKFYVDPLCR